MGGVAKLLPHRKLLHKGYNAFRMQSIVLFGSFFEVLVSWIIDLLELCLFVVAQLMIALHQLIRLFTDVTLAAAVRLPSHRGRHI